MEQCEHFLWAGFRTSYLLAASTFSGGLGVIERSRKLVSWFSNRCVVLQESSIDTFSFLIDDTILR